MGEMDMVDGMQERAGGKDKNGGPIMDNDDDDADGNFFA